MAAWGAFLTGFAVSAAYWPGMLSAVFVPRWAAIAILVPLLWRLDFSKLTPQVSATLAVLFFAASLSLVQSPDILTGLYELFLLLVLAMAFVGAASLERLDPVMDGVAAGLAISSGFVIAQLAGFQPVVHSTTVPAGLFFNSEVLAEFSALVLCWGLVRRRWWVVAATILPVLVCESRIAILVVAGCMLYAFWTPKRWPLYVAVAVIGALLAFGAIWYLGIEKMASAFHRITLWGTAAMSITAFGQGLGWSQVVFPDVRFVHSDMLQYLAEIGVAALFVLYFPYVIFTQKRGERAARVVFAGVCIEALVSFPLQFPATGFLAAVVAGHLLGRRSMVRVGEHYGGTEDGAGIQRGENGPLGIAAAGGWSRAALSVRSLFARSADLRPSHDRAGGGGG